MRLFLLALIGGASAAADPPAISGHQPVAGAHVALFDVTDSNMDFQTASEPWSARRLGVSTRSQAGSATA